MTTDVFRQHVDRLKAATTGQAIAADLSLRGRGKRYFCPACQSTGGKTPDLAVNDHGFSCFKCGESGDVIDLVVLATGRSKADAIRWLEDRTGVRRPASTKTRSSPTSRSTRTAAPDAIQAVQTAIQTPSASRPVALVQPSASALYDAFLTTVCRPLAGTPGADYLAGRGLDVDVADQVGIRYCDDLSPLWELADRASLKAAGLSSFYVFQKERLSMLVFPYRRHGQPVFLKARTLLSKADADRRGLPRFLNTGGVVPCLWNHDAIAGADRVLICEGEVDALTAIVAGYVGVGLPGWSHWKDVWTPDFAGKDVVLVLDADDAGRQGTRQVVASFIRAGQPVPRQIVLDEGKDLNDVFQESMKDGKAER